MHKPDYSKIKNKGAEKLNALTKVIWENIPRFLGQVQENRKRIVVRFVNHDNLESEEVTVFTNFITFIKNQQKIAAIKILANSKLYAWEDKSVDLPNNTQLAGKCGFFNIAAINVFQSLKE